jgi:restriction system protein
VNEEPTDFLNAASAQAKSSPVEITIRELIGLWGAQRRGYWVVDRITRELAEAGLTTEPPFADGWIDGSVKLVPVELAPETSDPHSDSKRSESPTELDTTLRVGSLPSSNQGVAFVPPEDSLVVAESIMLRYDFSQLAVMTASDSRDLKGAVSWESIAQAQLRDSQCSLKDSLIPSDPVDLDDDLLGLIPRIVASGFVFVRARDRRISGIVTMADLSLEFSNLATPFFLLGEIERRLRRRINECFDGLELGAIKDDEDEDRQISSADDLTFGEYGRLLENPDRWKKLGWPVDRKTFTASLDEIRDIRNDIMHFSPDPLAEAQLSALKAFIKWLRIMDPRP